ncbi:MAG TPA: methylmalonyl-CoA mutase subunit beta, partial [Salinimicrobium sp.]|nr:methylmalonyl-CoA mutase subunit beta [Salinimicrobium sp.]
VSAKQWKQKIQFDLKGADYNDTLVWNSNDGVNVKPFYHPDEAPEPFHLNLSAGWNICEKIYVVSAEKSNQNAKQALTKGAESIWFIISSEKIDPEILFSGIELKKILIYFQCEFLSSEYILNLKKYLAGRKHQIHLQTDIIGNLARSGNWYSNLKEDHGQLKKIVRTTTDFRSVLSIDASLYQNSGANIPQQLAYSLAHVNEYLNYFNENSLFNSEEKKEFKPLFLISVGSNYFFEIAKLHALRLIYATLAREYEFSKDCFILAQPSKRNKTLYDYNVNLLRSTTECMSSILGGADSICNMSYDEIYHKTNEFGARVARNQLLVLKNESYFEKVANPAEGSYYIESLTRQFAEKALEIFKEIEKGGGFLKQLKEGTIQKKIAESATREQEQFDKGELILVGTNKYRHEEDKMKEDLELYPFLKQNPQKTLIKPILEKRLAENMEQKRLKAEN